MWPHACLHGNGGGKWIWKKGRTMRITKYGHACLLLEDGGVKLLIDPGVYSGGLEVIEGLSAVLITHQHSDHLSPESLRALKDKNPKLRIYCDEGSYALLEKLGDLEALAVHAGEEFELDGVRVKVAGTDHAVIHPTILGIPNVGYLVGKRFFYPGDNFTRLDEPVEILALPAGAPWLKISEAIDYMLAVHPEVAIPVHDAVLAIPEMNYGLFRRFAEPVGIEIRVVPNGQSTEA
jgi:L-ascorbate metabolism protein UlaG (beta-lactamase superfamily)